MLGWGIVAGATLLALGARADLAGSAPSPSSSQSLSPSPSPSAAAERAAWPLVIGHRGLGQGNAPEPENSIAALEGAFRRGVHAVEFDVQLSADGEVVLAHDPRLERISSGQGCVGDASLGELRSLMLRDGTGALHRDMTFGTFREALRYIRRYDSPARPFVGDVHIKVFDLLRGDITPPGLDDGGCPITDIPQLTDKVLRIAREEGMMGRLIFTAFDRRVLDRIRREAPSARLGLLGALGPEHAIGIARGRYEFVALAKQFLGAEDVEAAHRAGLKVLVWSPRERADLVRELRELQVDGVITDGVDDAVQVRAQLP